MTRPQVRPDIAAMDGYHSPQVDVEVRLNTNEAPEPPPRAFVDALQAAVGDIEWHRYPDRAVGDLRERLADRYGVSPEQVFAANGSNEVLQSVLLAFGGPGRTAAVFEPTYALHSHIAQVTGTRVVTGERSAAFEIDLAEVERVLTEERPEVVFLCSPNNPTGRLDPPEVLDTVLELAASTGSLVVVDEAYGQFAPSSAVSLLDDDRPLVVSRTFSKTWSMAALRLGYLLGPAWVIGELDKVVLPYHLDAVKQVAGCLALDHGDAMDRRVASLVSERERVMAAFDALDVTAWSSAANFILFRPDGRPGQAVWQALVDRSVLVRNCSSWDRLDGCLRVTIGTPDENDRFLAALTEVLSLPTGA